MSRILIVDDQEDVRLALVMLMEDQGHAVFEGGDGSEVVPLARRHRPDLILLDLMMPAVDGFQALRMLRDEPVLGAIPVIVVTARPAPEDRTLAFELGAVDFVSKPWSIEGILGSVNAALARAGTGARSVD